MLDSYDDARVRLLKAGARIVPCGASIMVQLAGAADLDRFVRVEKIAGFDLHSFNDFSPVKVNPDECRLRLTTYSAPFEVFDFDLQSNRRIAAERKAIAVSVTASGLCYGVLQWIRLTLAPGVQFENAPEALNGDISAGLLAAGPAHFPSAADSETRPTTATGRRTRQKQPDVLLHRLIGNTVAGISSR
jgi:hypothetical protein